MKVDLASLKREAEDRKARHGGLNVLMVVNVDTVIELVRRLEEMDRRRRPGTVDYYSDFAEVRRDE